MFFLLKFDKWNSYCLCRWITLEMHIQNTCKWLISCYMAIVATTYKCKYELSGVYTAIVEDYKTHSVFRFLTCKYLTMFIVYFFHMHISLLLKFSATCQIGCEFPQVIKIWIRCASITSLYWLLAWHFVTRLRGGTFEKFLVE